jgi:copper resistance protein D
MSGDPVAFAQVVLAALGDIAFALTLGAMLLDGWFHREQACGADSPALRTARVAGIALLLCDFASLWLLSMAMSGASVAEAGASLWLVASATHAGIGWTVALAGSVVLLLAAMRRRTVVPLMLIGALIAAAGKAAIGHAADAGAFSLAEGVQTVHLLATGVWGGVVIAGALLLPTAGARFMRVLRHISRTAMIAVALVLASGIYNAIRGIGGTGGAASVLTSSTWGHALVVKIVLVISALVFGALNRWIAMPRGETRGVIVLMRIEALAMTGVFIAASVLSHSMPG